MLPMTGLNRAMNSPWVVMINPTDEGATPSPSRIRFNTGAMILPAFVAAAYMQLTGQGLGALIGSLAALV